MPVDLRPHQILASDAFVESPLQRKMVVLPTGAGKTFLGLSIAKRMNARTLWLAHRAELITQPLAAAKLVWPEASTGIVKAELNQYMRQVVFASVQSAQQLHRIEQLQSQKFDLVVVDEAHRSLAKGYQDIIKALGCYADNGPQLLGITATPERTDQGALDQVYEKIVFQLGINDAIEQGYLVSPRVVERPINVDLDRVSIKQGDYGAQDLDIALMNAGIVEEITSAVEEHCIGKKVLIFVISVHQAELVSAALMARGHKIVALSGETPTDERREILAKLKSGEISGVVNVQILTEGFDEPSVDCILMARPTQSKPLAIQMIGRGLRLYPGKSDCLVVDMVALSKHTDLVQAAVLFGIRGEKNQDKKLPQGPPLNSEEYWRARLKTQIDGMGGAPRTAMRWIATADGAGWLLPAGEYGAVRILPADGDKWQIDVVGDEPQILSRESVPLEIGYALAEDFLRRISAIGLARKGAAWRNAPASEEQIAFLQKLGNDGANLTKGTAADLLTQLTAARAGELASSKQIKFLKWKGVRVATGMTKREASRAIAQLKAQGR